MRGDLPKKKALIASDMSQPSLLPVLPIANGYELPDTPFQAQQSVWKYPYEEVTITLIDKALLIHGRPQSPASRSLIGPNLGDPADNIIRFKVPQSVVAQMNRNRHSTTPPPPLIYRENSPGGRDLARPPPVTPPDSPRVPLEHMYPNPQDGE